jgi:hypothetical protein
MLYLSTILSPFDGKPLILEALIIASAQAS